MRVVRVEAKGDKPCRALYEAVRQRYATLPELSLGATELLHEVYNLSYHFHLTVERGQGGRSFERCRFSLGEDAPKIALEMIDAVRAWKTVQIKIEKSATGRDRFSYLGIVEFNTISEKLIRRHIRGQEVTRTK